MKPTRNCYKHGGTKEGGEPKQKLLTKQKQTHTKCPLSVSSARSKSRLLHLATPLPDPLPRRSTPQHRQGTSHRPLMIRLEHPQRILVDFGPPEQPRPARTTSARFLVLAGRGRRGRDGLGELAGFGESDAGGGGGLGGGRRGERFGSREAEGGAAKAEERRD